MSSATPKFVIASLSIDNVSWTPIVPSVPCNGLSISCASDIKIRTDSGDPNTQETIPASAEEDILPYHINTRFQAGQTVAFLQAVSGSPTVTLRYVG